MFTVLELNLLDEVEEIGSEEVIEVIPEKVQKDDEKFLEVLCLPPDSWEDWSTEEKKVVIDKAVAKEITRRFTLMRIIKFLYEKYPEPQYTKEITQGLEIPRQNLIHNLKKLVKTGVVERVFPSTIDMRTKYYKIVDKELVEKLIRRYHYLISFKFLNNSILFIISPFINHSQIVSGIKQFW